VTLPYRVGFAKVDVTPPVGTPYLGHVPRHPRLAGVHDPLYARATVIAAGETRVAIVSTDTLGLPDTLLGAGRRFVGEVKQEIARRTGLPASHAMIASNHVHSSAEMLGFRPLPPEARAWLDSLQQALVACVTAACADPVPARLTVARGAAPGLAMNRRGEDSLDDEVIALTFTCDRGPEVVLANYACHPVILQVQDQISADYVGAMVTAVEQARPGLRGCQFLLGACGDLDPTVGNTKCFEDAEEMGRRLAAEVLRLTDQPSEDAPAVVRAATTEVAFPSRPLPDVPVSGGTEGARLSPFSPSTDRLARFVLDEEAQVRIAEGTGPFLGEVQLLRLGPAVLAGIPGEPFCSLGRELKAMLAPHIGVPVGCANGYLGYLAPPEAWAAGGYETELGPWSKVGPEATGLVQEAVRALMPRIAG
jgi:neutral ceramidase